MIEEFSSRFLLTLHSHTAYRDGLLNNGNRFHEPDETECIRRKYTADKRPVSGGGGAVLGVQILPFLFLCVKIFLKCPVERIENLPSSHEVNTLIGFDACSSGVQVLREAIVLRCLFRH